MRHVSFRPSLTLAHRENRGLRGLAGKPSHPPLTDVPIAAYLFTAVFDVLSAALHGSHPAAGRQLFLAGTWVLLGGAAVSVLAALTGWADWHRSSEPGTQARRTVNAHALTMITVTVLVLADLALRGLVWGDRASTPALVVVLSVVAAALVTLGATIGGTLVFDYGFNVETAGDSPVWHPAEVDLRPGQKASEPTA
ncbi:MAG TPA: DUF2231 domain-containing protein [Marmoricola sp.]|nr:DUF2231 domain-containing protein [Marmoricola sp.]